MSKQSNILIYDVKQNRYEKQQTTQQFDMQVSSPSKLVQVKKKVQDNSQLSNSQISDYSLSSPVKLISHKKVKSSTFVFEQSQQEEDKYEYQQNGQITQATKGGQSIQYNEQLQEKNTIHKLQPQLSSSRKLRRSLSQNQQEQMVQKIQQRSQQQQIQSSNQDESDQQLSVNTSCVPVAMLKTNIDKLILLPIPQGFKITCLIKIDSIFLGLKNIYNLYLKGNESLILSAKKQTMSLVSHYNISKSKINHSKRNDVFVCYLQSNFSGTQWKMYQNQEQTMRISYKQTVFGYMSLRQMNVIKIDPEAKKRKEIIPPLQNILRKAKKKQKYILNLKTREPEKVKGKYKIDFHGLAKVASGKNFIICQTINKKQKECLLFGKQKQNLYLMEVKYPFTILEAFCLCLTSLDGKILVN